MSMHIGAIQQILPEQTTALSPSSNTGGSFQDVLGSAIGEVESSQAESAKSVSQFLSGEGQDLHSTILATQRADLEFQLFMQLRNRVVSTYQEIMKMQM